MNIETAKVVAYGICVACFVFAGVADLSAGQVKVGIVALLFALANGMIFLWR